MFIEFIKQVEEKRQNAQLAEHLFLFCNKLNKFNNTGAQIVDSFYHMTLELLKYSIFGMKAQDFAIFYATFKWPSLHNVTKSVNHWRFMDFIAWRYITPRPDII